MNNRDKFSIKIPKDATAEEIKAFMAEFMANWGKEKEPNEQSSKQD